MIVGPATYYRPEHRATLDDRTGALVDRRTHAMGGGYRLFYAKPVEFVRASGTKLYTADGAEYLDAYNNVPIVGHAHPRVVEAVATQASLINTHTRYLHETPIAFAEALTASLPEPLDRVVYTCTGSEANDLALRIVTELTGHTGVIVTENAYHGVTAAVAAVSPSLGGDDRLGQHVRTVRPPSGSVADLVADIDAAIADLQAAGHGVAALLIDSSFASDGLVVPSDTTRDALVAAAARIRATGGMVIGDEVQSGFGRLGDGLWGFTRHGIVPDIVTMGKPIANGFPVGAVVSSAAVLDDFGSRMRYFNTFGGSPVLIAAAQATWNTLHDEDLVARSAAVGTRLLDALRTVTADDDRIGDVRGAGLFLGIDVIDPDSGAADTDTTVALVDALREHGVIIGASGRHNNTLKVRPPLPFDDADAERFTTALAAALRSLS